MAEADGALGQGGLRTAVESRMRVLGGRDPFRPEFSCPVDPEAGPSSGEQGLPSPLDTGVKEPPSKG